MLITKVGFENNNLLLKSLLSSKYIQINSTTIPKIKSLKLTFPIFDTNSISKSKLLIIIMDFIENFTNTKVIIKKAKILIKKGVFFRCQVDLSGFNIDLFFDFFNDFVLTNSLLKYSNKLLK